MRSVEQFLLQTGIIDYNGAGAAKLEFSVEVTDENRHFIDPTLPTCSQCVVLGTLPKELQEDYVRDILMLYGEMEERVRASQDIAAEVAQLMINDDTLRMRTREALRLVPSLSFVLRSGFQVVTHLHYPEKPEPSACWHELLAGVFGGAERVPTPFIDVARDSMQASSSELYKFRRAA